jgi:hypothetical protein
LWKIEAKLARNGLPSGQKARISGDFPLIFQWAPSRDGETGAEEKKNTPQKGPWNGRFLDVT